MIIQKWLTLNWATLYSRGRTCVCVSESEDRVP